MKIIVLLAVFALAVAEHHHDHDQDHTLMPCATEVKNILEAAIADCRNKMTTPMAESTTAAATGSDDDSSSEEDDPARKAAKKIIRQCVSAKMEAITDAVPIFQECLTKFNSGEITENKKNKCVAHRLMRSCDVHPPCMTTTAAA